MPNPSIPEEVKKRIEKDASNYSCTLPGYLGYIDGATAEAARAEEIDKRLKIAESIIDKFNQLGDCPLVRDMAGTYLRAKALQQKGGENE